MSRMRMIRRSDFSTCAAVSSIVGRSEAPLGVSSLSLGASSGGGSTTTDSTLPAASYESVACAVSCSACCGSTASRCIATITPQSLMVAEVRKSRSAAVTCARSHSNSSAMRESLPSAARSADIILSSISASLLSSSLAFFSAGGALVCCSCCAACFLRLRRRRDSGTSDGLRPPHCSSSATRRVYSSSAPSTSTRSSICTCLTRCSTPECSSMTLANTANLAHTSSSWPGCASSSCTSTSLIVRLLRPPL
mmetsp:Transcript_33066/g.98389  ORF Transcript_33066/g.98389 Transcript_33066/m.98389 type:complete len:251 (+) Transcript_33066:479-1231(+)